MLRFLPERTIQAQMNTLQLGVSFGLMSTSVLTEALAKKIMVKKKTGEDVPL